MAIPAPELIDAAKDAGLRYVSDDRPGIRRHHAGHGFRYDDADGEPVTDEKALARIRHLAIPPAWTDVWISADARGHIQATGRDAKGRKQYRYHERFREIRDASKYERMLEFARALPTVRERIDADLRSPKLTRDRVLATILRLLEMTLIRVGNEEYARENQSYGLTTLREKHVTVEGSRMRFRFRGKSGKDHDVELTDRRVARVLRALQELPGQELFRYVAEDGEVRTVASDDVNAYLREIAGDEFTAKDFRTWAATVLAARALGALGHVENERMAKKNVTAAIEHVAARLGNTPTVCRKCYVHPAVVDSYLDGELEKVMRGRVSALEEDGGLAAEERALLALLERRLANTTKESPKQTAA